MRRRKGIILKSLPFQKDERNNCNRSYALVGLRQKTVVRKLTAKFMQKKEIEIGDLLSFDGSTKSRMNFENIRILKDIRNSVNRSKL